MSKNVGPAWTKPFSFTTRRTRVRSPSAAAFIWAIRLRPQESRAAADRRLQVEVLAHHALKAAAGAAGDLPRDLDEAARADERDIVRHRLSGRRQGEA